MFLQRYRILTYSPTKQTVYILEDNDDAGRAHARKVAVVLRGIVLDIRIVAFPGVPAGEDVSCSFFAGRLYRDRQYAGPASVRQGDPIGQQQARPPRSADQSALALSAAARPGQGSAPLINLKPTAPYGGEHLKGNRRVLPPSRCANRRYPSCLISCSQSAPERGRRAAGNCRPRYSKAGFEIRRKIRPASATKVKTGALVGHGHGRS
jgi:hypothetical protein